MCLLYTDFLSNKSNEERLFAQATPKYVKNVKEQTDMF